MASILKFDTVAEGLKIANDTSYGLGSAVFTRDVRKAHHVARKLQAGQVWVNSSNDGAPSIPFGGYKNSGIGRELGEYAISVRVLPTAANHADNLELLRDEGRHGEHGRRPLGREIVHTVGIDLYVVESSTIHVPHPTLPRLAPRLLA